MTSPSRKNHQTTPPSTRRRPTVASRIWAATGLAAFALGGSAVLAEIAQSPATTSTTVTAEQNPLEALKARSAARRWKDATETYGTSTVAVAVPEEPSSTIPELKAPAAEEFVLPTQVATAPTQAAQPRLVAWPPAGAARNSAVQPLFTPPAQISAPGQQQFQQPLTTAQAEEPAAAPVQVPIVPQEQTPPAVEPIVPEATPETAPIVPEQDGLPGDGSPFGRPVRTPQDLKRITDIMPYADYEPDPEVAAQDPCLYQCPRPEGCPTVEGELVPACPEMVGISNKEYVPTVYPDVCFAWVASNVSHNPLYFEDVSLERYGHTYGCVLQPVSSVSLFTLQLIGLPYQMALDCPVEDVYALGYYRPGECAPKLHYQIPLNAKAAAAQAGVMTGLFYAIP